MQYDRANRPDRVPCDEGGLDACPYSKYECGSPGDESENGCGLAPENVEVVDFYPKWRTLGEAAFRLFDIEFSSELEADSFASKLMVIHNAYPAVEHAVRSSKEAEIKKSQHEKDSNNRRNAPRKV